jgi:hypothetical protein
MDEKEKTLLAHRRKQEEGRQQDEATKAYDTNNMESFLPVDPSPPCLVNPTPKQYIRKVRHLWVIK